MLGEVLLDGFGQVLLGGAGGFKLAQQCGWLAAHGLFDQVGQPHVLGAEDLPQPFDVLLDVAYPSGSLESSAQLRG
ncbi:hypothetical protein [Actinomadura sp. 9N215]|uniref:hypothetical protein n=1 Tax=Actinomadura sp. 9N215 TaxID=3375150 RepID=UPI003793DB89